MIGDVVQKEVEALIAGHGYEVVETDLDRPWGGYYRLAETDAADFLKTYFPDFTPVAPATLLSPKYLAVAPGQRLSWQYHHRRGERWHVLTGPVGISTSPDDTESPPIAMASGETIVLEPGERHRLIGQTDWGVVAEVWQHTDPAHPSDEDDIVRIQDDYHRESA